MSKEVINGAFQNIYPPDRYGHQNYADRVALAVKIAMRSQEISAPSAEKPPFNGFKNTLSIKYVDQIYPGELLDIVVKEENTTDIATIYSQTMKATRIIDGKPETKEVTRARITLENTVSNNFWTADHTSKQLAQGIRRLEKERDNFMLRRNTSLQDIYDTYGLYVFMADMTIAWNNLPLTDLDMQIETEIQMETTRAHTITFTQQIKKGDQEVAISSCKLVLFDPKGKSRSKIPEALVEKLYFIPQTSSK